MLSEAEKKELRKERDLLQAVRQAIIEAAEDKHLADGSLEIDDDDAVVSMGDTGAYVQAWVYVDEDDVDLPAHFHDTEEDIWDWPSDCANPVTRQELQDALRELLRMFKLIHSPTPFYQNQAAKAAAILLARMQGVDPIEDQTCYLRDDL